MKSVMWATILLFMSLSSAFPTVRIYDDRGGQIGEYLAKFKALRMSREQVVIERAVLEFHAAWDPTPVGQAVSSAGNGILWSNYPSNVRKWIIRHGGLHSRMIDLRGPELAAMHPICQ
jgi:hypothetical protein